MRKIQEISTHSTDVALRPLAPADGPAIAELFAQTPDAGQINFTARFKVDAYTELTPLHPDTAGVAAVLPITGQFRRHGNGRLEPAAGRRQRAPMRAATR